MAMTTMFKSKINTLEDLYLEHLRDLYDVETQLIETLPRMIDATTSRELRTVFERHLEETKGQQRRLEQVFKQQDEEPEGNTCKGIRGIIEEGEELLNRMQNDDVTDAGLIAAAQRVEHYEMAAYGTARTYARLLGQQEAARLLQHNLDEEGKANETLTRLADNHKNIKARESTR